MSIVISPSKEASSIMNICWVLEIVLLNPDGFAVNEIEKILVLAFSFDTEGGQELCKEERQFIIGQRGWMSPLYYATEEWSNGQPPWTHSLINKMKGKKISQNSGDNSFNLFFGDRLGQQFECIQAASIDLGAGGDEPFYFFPEDTDILEPFFSTARITLKESCQQVLEIRFRTNCGEIVESPAQRLSYMQGFSTTNREILSKINSRKEEDDKIAHLRDCLSRRAEPEYDMVVLSHPAHRYDCEASGKTAETGRVFNISWPKASANSESIVTPISLNGSGYEICCSVDNNPCSG